MNHYICIGTDRGVSDTPGVCQGTGCSREGEQLEPCDCTDNMHHGRQTHDENPPKPLET